MVDAKLPLSAFFADRALGISAGTLGLVSVFMPWIAIPGFGINILQVMDLTNELDRFGYSPTVEIGQMSMTALVAIGVVILLLILGSVVSFFHRAGGALILTSWVMFAAGFYFFMPSIVRLFIGFGLGFFLAVIASIISLTRYAIVPYMQKRGQAQNAHYAAAPPGQFPNPPYPPPPP